MGRETVLVVEDEELVRSLSREALAAHGFNVLTAGDGQEGVEVFRRNIATIAVVVLDLTLPAKSGAEVCAEVLRLRPGTRVLVTSG